MAVSRICSIADCYNPARTRGWCMKHYSRFRKYGSADAPVEARSPRGAAIRYLREIVLPYKGDDCLGWPFSTNKGRALIWWEGRLVPAARVVCTETYGPPPTPEHESAHSCGKGHEGCVTPRHLRWATIVENMADKLIHGTHPRGERNGLAKLTEADVRAIRALSESGESQYALARRFGVSRENIREIAHHRRWHWLV